MFRNKNEEREQASNTIEIMNLGHLEMLVSQVAKTAQMDFGLSWNVETEQADDERAFALAIASIHEMGARISSDDDDVIAFIKKVTNKRVRKEYYKEEK